MTDKNADSCKVSEHALKNNSKIIREDSLFPEDIQQIYNAPLTIGPPFIMISIKFSQTGKYLC